MKIIKAFTRQQLLREIERCGLAVPVDKLIAMGEKRGWMTRKGKKFKSCTVFATCMNGVYLQQLRKDSKQNKSKYDLFSDDIVSYINEK